MSWHEAFSVDYAAWSAHMTEDVPFYVGLARAADGPVVELAVGDGRVAVPVAWSWTTGRPAGCGGRPATSGSACSTSPGSSWSRCTAVSPVSRWPTTAPSTSSSLAGRDAPRPARPGKGLTLTLRQLLP